MSSLSTSLFHLRNQLLSLAQKHIQEVGFTNEALVRAIDATGKRAEINDAVLSQLFERGFPSALVEYVVSQSNVGTQQMLEAKYNKNAIIKAIAKNEDNFALGRLALPTSKSVAEDAMLAKLAFLQPLVEHWPSAVAIEYQPSNVPYTMIRLAEFIDTAAYYMERVDNLSNLLEPARRILNARMMASYIPADTAHNEPGENSPSEQFLHSFVRGIPLSSGPHLGESRFSMEWYTRRAKMGILYSTTVTSLMGDASRDAIETRTLTKTLVAAMF